MWALSSSAYQLLHNQNKHNILTDQNITLVQQEFLVRPNEIFIDNKVWKWNKMVSKWVNESLACTQNLMRQTMQFDKSVNSYVP